MTKNKYNLSNKEDRKELFNNYLINELPNLNFSEFEERLNFLCNIGLSDEWLNVVAITIDELVCPNRLTSETSIVHSCGIKDLLTLAGELNGFDDETINRYVEKLNTKSFARISVLSEIKIASSYSKRGYSIRIEPPNGRIGRSGLEGKSDLGVNFNGEWIYFEITHENYDITDNSVWKIGEINDYINEQVKKQDLLQWRMKINARIIDKNKVLGRDWRYNFLEHLKKSASKINAWKEFDGIKYVIKNCIPDEPVFSLGIPITDTKRHFNMTIKKESKQIPKYVKGVIATELNSTLNINSFPIYAQEILSRDSNDIIAIIVWYQSYYQIVCKPSVTCEVLDFLSIPFK
jgi:hypothetical protein